MTGVHLDLFAAGHCVHPRHVVLRDGGLTPMRFPASFALVRHPRRGPLVFDTGYSERFFAATRRLPARIHRWVTPVTFRPEQDAAQQLATVGVRADEVESVLLSHFHADHIAGLAAFPRAALLHLDSAWRAVRELRGFAGLRRGFLPELVPHDFVQRARALEENALQPLPGECAPFRVGIDLYGDGCIWVVPLPGHAAGQVGLFLRLDGGRDVLLCADACWTAHSYREDRMPHAVTRLLFDDWRAYRDTLRSIHTLHLERPMLEIVPAHCEETLRRYGVDLTRFSHSTSTSQRTQAVSHQ